MWRVVPTIRYHWPINQLFDEIVNQMPAKLYLKHLAVGHVAFGYSVLYELMLSLHVLNAYKRHPLHITWALNTLKQIPEDLRAEKRFFSMILSQIINMLWQPEKVLEPSFEREFKDLQDRPIENFTLSIIARLFHGQSPTGKRIMSEFPTLEDFRNSITMQDNARQWMATYFPDSVSIIDALLSDAVGLQARFMRMLEQYWALIFRDEWATLEPLFQAEIKRRGQLLYHDGTLSAIEHLNPKMRLDVEQSSVTFISVDEGETIHFTPNDKLNLQPSYFLYPSMIFYITTADNDEDLALSITYPIPEIQMAARSPVPSETLLNILRGISDRTRLQILQLVTTKPRSTSEIAQILNLSDAAVSKHLKQLHQSGWVTSERSSYYVLYRAVDTPLQDLIMGLETLLQP
jgi:DNA-binding transcriptional ArsR family regulator